MWCLLLRRFPMTYSLNHNNSILRFLVAVVTVMAKNHMVVLSFVRSTPAYHHHHHMIKYPVTSIIQKDWWISSLRFHCSNYPLIDRSRCLQQLQVRYQPGSSRSSWLSSSTSRMASSLSSSNHDLNNNNNIDDEEEEDEDLQVQWALFEKYHARGSWKGIWTSYDDLGNVVDETVASVNLQVVSPSPPPQKQQQQHDNDDTKGNEPNRQKDLVVEHSHTIVVGAKVSDCETCYDTFETKTIPVATYSQPYSFVRNGKCASCAMVIGPSIVKGGAMVTELILSFEDGRVRVLLYHAPVYQKLSSTNENANDPNGPPDGFKLYRVMISREALRAVPPTPESELAELANHNPLLSSLEENQSQQPRFYGGVPPYVWHYDYRKWGGTSWTWGPTTGHRGWQIQEMEEVDCWHGRPTGDDPNVWTLRLPGGILLQAPRILLSGTTSSSSSSITTTTTTGLCRLAWLSCHNNQHLLRVEAGIRALEPVYDVDDNDNDVVIGFQLPSLVSLRCDMMQAIPTLTPETTIVATNDGVDYENDDESMGRGTLQDQQSSSHHQEEIPPSSGLPSNQNSNNNNNNHHHHLPDDENEVQTILKSLQL